jgi:hypothetical protein
MTPTRMRMKAMSPRGATATSLRMSAAIIPAFSATPTPAMAMSVTATTANPAKLSTKLENRNRMPSMESRLRTSNSSSTTVYSGIVTSCWSTTS